LRGHVVSFVAGLLELVELHLLFQPFLYCVALQLRVLLEKFFQIFINFHLGHPRYVVLVELASHIGFPSWVLATKLRHGGPVWALRMAFKPGASFPAHGAAPVVTEADGTDFLGLLL